MKPTSLRGRLRWMIIALLLLFLLPLAFYSFYRTSDEMAVLSDARLAEAAHTVAALIRQSGLQAFANHDGVIVPVQKKSVLAAMGEVATHESEVGFQVFDRDGKLVLGTVNLMTLPATPDDRSAYHDLKKQHHVWRVFNYVDPQSQYVIRTADRYDSRENIVYTLWVDHGVPFLLGLPVLALLVGWAVGRGLRPLASLTTALSAREPGSRERIELPHAPRELRPVLGALNEQLVRQEDALERERRFSADVAHELRTPLASILLNLESAMETVDPDEIQDSLAGAHHSVATLSRRVEQLLTLARMEAGAASTRFEAVDLMDVAGGVVKELTPVIQRRGVELGFAQQDGQVLVQGYAPALIALLRNLLENSLRYVPAGGRIQLAIAQGRQDATLEVIDDGPGIPTERRHAVFARFHREAGSRGEGYGLGLSIVARAATLHRASIELLDSPLGRGLRVRVSIPLLCP
ncbi:sensor histidine kinase [Dyella telluris]|uniref:histidine kinase n=1 Tax=Dyella telluris TaxID=2763498 RepID=A0A7G8Q8I8_9GAMM|nr:ATP-binding protein [Dyella telluris]QNK03096.1 sensor histidine kinase N-terminal domain-containing protein [Dyella telluris]